MTTPDYITRHFFIIDKHLPNQEKIHTLPKMSDHPYTVSQAEARIQTLCAILDKSVLP